MDNSIAPIKVPDSAATLGSFLNIARGAQELQTGKLQQQRVGVNLQQEQGALDARNAVAKVMADPSVRDPESGLLDLNKLAPALQAADPKNYVWQDAFTKTAKVNGDMMTLKSAAMNLSDQAQAFAAQRIGAVLVDPESTRNDLNTAFDDVLRVAPTARPQIDIIRSHLSGLDKETAGKWRQVATIFRNQAFPLAAQQPQTSGIGGVDASGGAATIQTQTNPLYGRVGPVPAQQSVPMAVPPAAAETVGQDQTGNPVRVVKDAKTGVITLQPMNTRGAAGNPPLPMYTFPPGESAQTKAQLEAERGQAKDALAQAPVMHQTNRGILEEIERAGPTGQIGPRVQAIASTIGGVTGNTDAERQASAYDIVGKYLERNAIAAAQGMGPHTNAGLESQIRANGSMGYNPTAIKKITKLNDALVSGVEAYQPGLEKAIQGSPNQIFAKRQFDQQWAQNFDPRVMILFNAKQSGDTKEIGDIMSSLGGKDSPAAKELLRKARNLEMLSITGRLQ